ncbi:MAG: hypothetical protein OEY52_05785 [Gammaproteobacteria bacterium]|nr:hypothetical protein [Gammaproteobacteria bacterium]
MIKKSILLIILFNMASSTAFAGQKTQNVGVLSLMGDWAHVVHVATHGGGGLLTSFEESKPKVSNWNVDREVEEEILLQMKAVNNSAVKKLSKYRDELYTLSIKPKEKSEFDEEDNDERVSIWEKKEFYNRLLEVATEAGLDTIILITRGETSSPVPFLGYGFYDVAWLESFSNVELQLDVLDVKSKKVVKKLLQSAKKEIKKIRKLTEKEMDQIYKLISEDENNEKILSEYKSIHKDISDFPDKRKILASTYKKHNHTMENYEDNEYKLFRMLNPSFVSPRTFDELTTNEMKFLDKHLEKVQKQALSEVIDKIK